MRRISRTDIFTSSAAAFAAVLAVTACSSQPAATSASSSNAAGSTFVIKYGGKLPENNPQGIGQVEFAKLAEKLSNGRIQVNNYFNGVLGSSASMNDQVHGDIIQMTDTSPANLETMYPGMGVFSVPFLFSSEDAALAAARGPDGSQIAQSFEQKTGIKVLAWDEFGMADIIGDKPFVTLSNLRGQKVRSQSDEYTQKPFSLVGSIPVRNSITACRPRCRRM
jgi:TRAP-type C4-dicarboxylate transport system substrate-binding protein